MVNELNERIKKYLSNEIISEFMSAPVCLDTMAQIVAKLNDKFYGECQFCIWKRDSRLQTPSFYDYFIVSTDTDSDKIRIEFKTNGEIYVSELLRSVLKAE